MKEIEEMKGNNNLSKNFLVSLQATVQKQLSHLPLTDSLLLAISGGADSVALLYLLLELGYCNLTLCHFNHQLRGIDSDQDETFVKNLAKKLHLSLEIGRANVKEIAAQKHLSLETAAREARYHFFAAIAQKENISKLLLAHHADDQIETCFFNFLRGTGSAGLAGMLPSSQRTIQGTTFTLIRPLLSISKEKLKIYLEKKQIPFCHDATNDSHLPTRNRLRHRLFPLLDEIFGKTYRSAILRTATILEAEDSYLESLILSDAINEALSIKALQQMPLALRRRTVHAWLRKQSFDDIGFVEVERVLSLLEENNPSQVNLPKNRHACRSKEIIFIKK